MRATTNYRRRAPVRLLASSALAVLAGVAAGVSFAPLHLVYLLPLAVAALTLLCMSAGAGVRRGFWLGFCFGTAFMLVLLPWLLVIGWYAWIPLSVVEGLFFGLAGLATAAVRRLPWWPLWAASSWILVEALRDRWPLGGFPWGRLGFAAEDTPLAPLFAYVGPAGVGFAMALLGTVLAWALLHARRHPLRAVAALVAACIVAGAAAVFPWTPPAPSDRVRVAAVQGNVPRIGLDAFTQRRVVLDNHVQATLNLAARIDAGKAPRPDLVVWPENSSDIDPYTDPVARQEIVRAVRAVGVPLLMGAVIGERVHEPWHNRAIVWSADGVPGAYYDKIHPVPFGEYVPFRSLLASRIPALDQIPTDMARGKRPGILQVGPAKVGVVMCFEVAYDGLVRDLVTHGARLIVVPTNNATYTGTGQLAQQFAMSRLRAVETGRFVVIASTNGISGIIGPTGEVLDRAPVRTQAVLERSVGLSTARTPAVRFETWVEWGLVAVAGCAALVGLLQRERRMGRR